MVRYGDLKYLEIDGFYIDLFQFPNEYDMCYYEDKKYRVYVQVRRRIGLCDELVTTLATYEFTSMEEAEEWIDDFWSGECKDPCVFSIPCPYFGDPRCSQYFRIPEYCPHRFSLDKFNDICKNSAKLTPNRLEEVHS